MSFLKPIYSPKYFPKYSPKGILKNPHFQTIYANVIRKVSLPSYQRERIHTHDGDFFDLDWSIVSKPISNSKNLIILLYGMEGSSTTSYVKGIVKGFSDLDFDIAVLNYRGSSGEKNKSFRSYHAGFTDDLWQTLDVIGKKNQYENIFLVGVSLGGNIVLNFLAEIEDKKKKSEYYSLWKQKLRAGIAISAPLHLESTSFKMLKWENKIYLKRFLKRFYRRYKNHIDILGKEKVDNIKKMKSFEEFDDDFTAPFYGYKNAKEYWKVNSSYYFLEKIKKPAFILVSKDDTLLSSKSRSIEPLLKNKNNILFEATHHGGHVGFMPEKWGERYWHEKRIEKFVLDFV